MLASRYLVRYHAFLMSHWIYSAFVGLIIGFCARFLLPGYDGMGWIMTMLVGIVGAYVGSAIGSAAGKLKPGQPAGWLWSIIGAMIVLVAIRMI
jgi:uncharacterized membrane protein YeaQ/YmgE (transglycosylase-associated protein family)